MTDQEKREHYSAAARAEAELLRRRLIVVCDRLDGFVAALREESDQRREEEQ